jgi:hypothetical protein
MFRKDSAACPNVTVPKSSEATAPIPAAKPSLKPNGRLIIRKIVVAKMEIAAIER